MPGKSVVKRRGYRDDDPERQEKIRQLSALGLTEREIARALNVSKSTVHYWMTKPQKVA
jgi:DNA-binding NarL/FixJ family response regulator